MRKTFALLVASTALGAVIGVPAWSAMNAGPKPLVALFQDEGQALPLILASGDDDDDERSYARRGHDDDDDEHGNVRRGHDDDDDEHDDDCDDDNEDECGLGAANPAPAGTVAPPQNGLFEDGAAPKVQVN